jgi:MFS family permease
VLGRGERPEVLRREVVGVGIVVAAVLVASAVAGVVWGLLAPTERLRVTQPGRAAVLTGESLHLFDAVGMFLCIGAVVAVLSAVGAWRVRITRGPTLVLGMLFASGLGAALMMWVGEGIAGVRHPRPDDPVIGQIVALPAEVGTDLALLIQPFLAALVLLFLAALHPSVDLGSGAAGLLGDLRPADFGDEPDAYRLPYGAEQYRPSG